MEPLDRPVLLFDADCGFCRRWIARWRWATGDSVEYDPYQEAAPRFPEIPVDAFATAVHLFEPDGRVSRGAEAVFRVLATAPGRRWPLRIYENVRPFAWIAERCYRGVARHRSLAERVTNWIWGAYVVPPGEGRTTALFLRAMGAVYVMAFLSLWVQVIGLYGADGILPIHPYLSAAGELGRERFWFLPSLLWLNSSNLALHAVCALGVVCGACALVGFFPAGALAGAWLAYLSVASVGQAFLHFQWDGLLLEAGFIAILLAPWRLRLRAGDARPPARAALWLARWLLFRLMVSSAAVKLNSHDPSWRALTALDFHYFTQPLPPWTAWYAANMPGWFHRLSVLVMFVIEGILPFLIAFPRRIRFAAAAGIVTLQVLILVTGNYGFFNILTIVLCIPLLDDGALPSRRPVAPPPPVARVHRVRRTVAVALFVISLVPFSFATRVGTGLVGRLATVYRAVSPLQLVNPYGLFAVMTTDRPEIIMEGSRDGHDWKPYAFKFKPGDLSRRPPFVTPHMPRLDWQMWFAALGDVRQNRWFLFFCQRLLEGSRDVTALMGKNPFPDAPPRYLRARVFMYRFTTPAERRRTGAWWTRTLRGPYVPTLMLENGRLARAPDDIGT